MGSVKLKDLKAYVRYDGSGRVVAGSLVFRKKKPKNGRWVEIPKNLCCNPNPSSTTTTTTGGGGVTPTAFTESYWINGNSACTTTTQGSITFYASSSVLAPGLPIYMDAGLTIPVSEGIALAIGMTRYIVGPSGVLYNLNCTSGLLSGTRSDVCDQSAPNVSYGANSNDNLSVTSIYADFNALGYAIGNTIYRGFYVMGSYGTQPFVVQSQYVASQPGAPAFTYC